VGLVSTAAAALGDRIRFVAQHVGNRAAVTATARLAPLGDRIRFVAQYVGNRAAVTATARLARPEAASAQTAARLCPLWRSGDYDELPQGGRYRPGESLSGIGSYQSLRKTIDSGFGAFGILLIVGCSANANRSLKLA
jgi:hypothetical protein